MTASRPPDHPALSAQERAAVLAALADAHRYFRRQVDRSWVPDYLNRRNLYSRLVPDRLGYAPSGWTTTRDHLRRQGYTDETLEGAGLVRRTAQGRLVDVFRDRLMVPLTTPDAGTLVGFIGRVGPVAAVDTPRYLNSPASAVFVKHELLYGLHESAVALSFGAMPVLVEGPLDRLAVTTAAYPLHYVGLAPCGTALSPDQAAALVAAVGPRRPVAVAFDPDPAGRDATRRAWETLTDAGAQHLRHVTLPAGKDPAELIRNGRGQTLIQAISHSTPLAHAVADATIASTHLSGSDWQRNLLTARQLFRDDLHRVPAEQVADYVTHVAARLHLDIDTATAAAADAVTAGPAQRGVPAASGPAPPGYRTSTAHQDTT